MFQKIFALSFVFVISGLLNTQAQSYELKGHISEVGKADKIYIQKLDDNKAQFHNLDSIYLNENNFSYSAIITESTPSMLFLSIPQTKGTDRKVLFIPEAGTINIELRDVSTIGGTPANEDLQKFMDLQASLNMQLEEITAKYLEMNQTSVNRDKERAETEALFNQLKEATFSFAKKNIKNELGEYVTLYFYGILTPDQVLDLISQTRLQFRESKIGKETLAFYEAMLIREGRGMYKDLKLKDIDGNDVSLSDYIGKDKIVLIDFWASWCGPCIKEMPNLVSVYNEYKDKGFEIVGVSLDDKKQSWTSAIERLNITWPQMSDLKGWKSEAARIYAVNSIPYTLLIDKNGNVIASLLYADELRDKLKELLN